MGSGELKTSPANKLIISQLGHLLELLLAKCQKTSPRVGEGRKRSGELEESGGHQKKGVQPQPWFYEVPAVGELPFI